ncbi:hypothetical protein SVAN01_01697 [Stagonosporopsis vannaccii]|nr:hypothetical protein SVAN01_01697 [Stagonosporopsis vannaccii]
MASSNMREGVWLRQDEGGRRKWEEGKRRCERMPAAKRASADAHVHTYYGSERRPGAFLTAATPAVLAWKRALEAPTELKPKLVRTLPSAPAQRPSTPPLQPLRAPAEVAPRLIETCSPPSSRRTKVISARTSLSRALQLHVAPSPPLSPLFRPAYIVSAQQLLLNLPITALPAERARTPSPIAANAQASPPASVSELNDAMLIDPRRSPVNVRHAATRNDPSMERTSWRRSVRPEFCLAAHLTTVVSPSARRQRSWSSVPQLLVALEDAWIEHHRCSDPFVFIESAEQGRRV